MELKIGTYSTDQSDIEVVIHKIYHRCEKYFKVKLSLVNKINGIEYELNKNYNLYRDNISHWKKLNKEDKWTF